MKNLMSAYREFPRRSITDRDGFRRDEAGLIDWQTPSASVLAAPP
jgi:hypothetical protein